MRARGFSVLVGLGAGALSGLLGIGGGLVVGPALLLMGLPLRLALGSALCVVAPVAAAGVLTECLTAPEHLFGWFALALAIGGQLGAPLGAWILPRMPEQALRTAFLAVVLYAALRNLGWLGLPPPAEPLAGLAGGARPLELGLALGLGVLAGVASSLFGIGGGVVMVPGLIFLVGGFLFHEAAATSLLAMVPISARAALLAHRQGRVDGQRIRLMVPAALLATVAAVLVRNDSLAPETLAFLFGLFLMFVAARLLRDLLRHRSPAGTN